MIEHKKALYYKVLHSADEESAHEVFLNNGFKDVTPYISNDDILRKRYKKNNCVYKFAGWHRIINTVLVGVRAIPENEMLL